MTDLPSTLLIRYDKIFEHLLTWQCLHFVAGKVENEEKSSCSLFAGFYLLSSFSEAQRHRNV